MPPFRVLIGATTLAAFASAMMALSVLGATGVCFTVVISGMAAGAALVSLGLFWVVNREMLTGMGLRF